MEISRPIQGINHEVTKDAKANPSSFVFLGARCAFVVRLLRSDSALPLPSPGVTQHAHYNVRAEKNNTERPLEAVSGQEDANSENHKN